MGGWVGGWVGDRKIEEEQAVRMSCCLSEGLGGVEEKKKVVWVSGWMGGWGGWRRKRRFE